MPRGDRTGPWGHGPMTGRGMGFCAGFVVPGYANPSSGRGFGFGRGLGYGRGMGFGRRLGRGWGRGFGRGRGFGVGYGATAFRPYSYAEPWGYGLSRKEALEEEAAFLKDELDAIKDRLAEIEDARRNEKEEGESDDRRSDDDRKTR